MLRRGFVDGICQILQLVVCQRGARSVEGVGFDDVRTGGKIGFMNLGDDLRLGKREQVVAAFQIDGMLLKLMPTKIGFGEFVALYHCPHGAVEQ